MKQFWISKPNAPLGGLNLGENTMMLEYLKDDLLRRLYDHPECDHEALLQALVAYKSNDVSDDEWFSIVSNLNNITNQTWQLEAL